MFTSKVRRTPRPRVSGLAYPASTIVGRGGGAEAFREERGRERERVRERERERKRERERRRERERDGAFLVLLMCGDDMTA